MAGPTAGGSPRRMPSAPPKRRQSRMRGMAQRRREHGWGEKELMARFICEVVSLIRVHEIFSDALENIAAKIFEES